MGQPPSMRIEYVTKVTGEISISFHPSSKILCSTILSVCVVFVSCAV